MFRNIQRLLGMRRRLRILSPPLLDKGGRFEASATALPSAGASVIPVADALLTSSIFSFMVISLKRRATKKPCYFQSKRALNIVSRPFGMAIYKVV